MSKNQASLSIVKNGYPTTNQESVPVAAEPEVTDRRNKSVKRVKKIRDETSAYVRAYN